MNKLAAVVGMAGSGKSEATKIFEKHGFEKIRFGDLTDEEIKRKGLELNEANERAIREQLREQHGMAAYALLNIPRIERMLASANVVIDGLYSWEEYLVLKTRFDSSLLIIAVCSSPETRYRRLGKRTHRPLTREEAISRDTAEIEKSNKGGPIAMADYTISNDTDFDNLLMATKRVLANIT